MRRAAAFVVCAGALLCGRASAQIVDVQRLLAEEPNEGLAGGVDGSVDLRRGDVDLSAVAGSANGRWRRGDVAAFALVQGERAETGGALLLEKHLEHVRFRWLGGAPQAETFFQHERDRFRRLEMRALWGVGPRAVLHESKRSSFVAGVAGMVELERLSAGPFEDSRRVSVRTRSSIYASGRRKLDERLSLAQTFYVQPAIDALEDARALSESELLVALSSRLSLRLTASVAYDSRPPDQVQSTQSAVKTSLHLDL